MNESENTVLTGSTVKTRKALHEVPGVATPGAVTVPLASLTGGLFLSKGEKSRRYVVETEKLVQFNKDFGFTYSVLDIIEALFSGDALPEVTPSSISCLASEAKGRLFSMEHLMRSEEVSEGRKIIKVNSRVL